MLSESDLLFVEDDFTLPELLEPPDLVLLEDLTVLLEPELPELFVDVFILLLGEAFCSPVDFFR